MGIATIKIFIKKFKFRCEHIQNLLKDMCGGVLANISNFFFVNETNLLLIQFNKLDKEIHKIYILGNRTINIRN